MNFPDEIYRRRDEPSDPAAPLQRRHFAAEAGPVAEAIEAVRALDADSYRELLGALGLTPDPRLSVPGCAPRRR